MNLLLRSQLNFDCAQSSPWAKPKSPNIHKATSTPLKSSKLFPWPIRKSTDSKDESRQEFQLIGGKFKT